jgi:hypothetical protein
MVTPSSLVGEEGLAGAPSPAARQGPIDDPESWGAEREDCAAPVQGGVDRGKVALYWGNEYHLGSSGAVVGS